MLTKRTYLNATILFARHEYLEDSIKILVQVPFILEPGVQLLDLVVSEPYVVVGSLGGIVHL